jgi:ribosome-associated protein
MPDREASAAEKRRTLVVNRRIRIPLAELRFEFARSSGAGGQNVNKVSSKARLRWPVVQSDALPPRVRERFLRRYARRITNDGEFVLASQRYRDQGRNVQDCLDKLRDMVREVAAPPKKRVATRPGRAAKERRLGDKKRRAEVKRTRGRVGRGDD